MHKNEQLLRDAYDAYGRNDIPGVTASWTEDTVWHMKGSTSLAGDYKGPEKILGLLAENMRLSNGTFKLEVQKIFADDDIGVVVCRSKATVAGEDFDSLTTHVHRIVDGKLAESWFLFEDAVALDAAEAKALKLVPAKV
jgi:ketosteroid isomerase-like protein